MKIISEDELKLIQLDILKYVHAFCEKHEIKYIIAYGTLLGAVRHQGFIPWDNDIDIAMLRDDYERFISEYTNERYLLYELRTDSECEIPYAKVYDSHTMLKEHSNSKSIGVNIDIFPIDNLYNDFEKSKREFESFRKLKIQRMLISRKPSQSTAWWKTAIYKIGKIMLAGISNRSISEKLSIKANKKREKNSEFVSFLTGSSLDYKTSIMQRRVFADLRLMLFEGCEFWAPKRYDEYLKISYGNYMKLPPESERKVPHLLDEVYWLD